MADTVEYFATTLPNKFTNDSDFRDSIQDIFEFQIEGAGTWHILPEGGVVEGNHEDPACVVTTDKETFDAATPGDDANVFLGLSASPPTQLDAAF